MGVIGFGIETIVLDSLLLLLSERLYIMYLFLMDSTKQCLCHYLLVALEKFVLFCLPSRTFFINVYILGLDWKHETDGNSCLLDTVHQVINGHVDV